MKNSKKLLFVLGVTALLASCAPKHTHTVSKEWKFDSLQHWHVCSECDEKLDVTNHTYSKQVAELKYLASSATCTSSATYYKSCECGAFDPSGETFVSGQALGHDWQAPYLDKQPTKVNYQVGETFEWDGVVIKHACGRTGCMETETLDNSLFTVVYDNGGTSFAAGESKVTLVAENEEPLYVTCIQVAKKDNQITGPESVKTTCTKAPDISGYSATSGGAITAKYYKDNVECSLEDLVKDAGTYTMKLMVAESQEYSSAEKVVNLEVEHNGNDVCDCGEVFKENITLPTFRKVTIDLSTESVIDLTSLGLDETKTYDSAKVYAGETEIPSTFVDGKITINNTDIPTSLTVGEHEDIKFIATSGDFDTVFSGKVLVATKIIKSVEEFKYNCSTIFTGTAPSGPKNDDFGADTYYVLGNDLSGEANTWTYKVNGLSKAIWHSSGLGSATGGFKGTFDGNNYSVIGGDLGSSYGDNTFGMFGTLGTGSVVKNLNITQVKYRGTQETCLLAKDMFNTTLENIFVEVLSDFGSGATLPATSGNYGVVNTGGASVTLKDSTFVLRNSDGSAIGKALYMIRPGTAGGVLSSTGSAVCGEVLQTGLTGVTYVGWELDNINTQLTFVWKPAPDNMYRMLLHGGNTQYNRIIVNGKALAPTQYSLWYNDAGTPVLDIPSAYMNAGDVIYVTKTVNGNAARGVAPAKN